MAEVAGRPRPIQRGMRARRGWWPLLVLAGLVAAYASLSLGRAIVDDLIEEDGPYEWAGTLGLLVASVAFGIAAARAFRGGVGAGESRWKPWVLAVLAIGLFFAAGEEISWGQRLLGISTPESVRDASSQGEINIHNLEAVHGTLDTGFQFFWAGLFVGVPLVAWLSPRAREHLHRYLPVAPVVIALLLTANYLLAQVGERLYDGSDVYESSYGVIHSINELKEAGVGVVLGIAAFLVLRRSGSRAPAPQENRRTASRATAT